MFNKYDKDYPKFANYFNKMINEDKLSHAFLVECRNIMNYKSVILEFIKKIIDKNKYEESLDTEALVANNNYPELKIIEPINSIIRKEQLLTLQKEFSIKPIYGRYLIYVIDGAEYLNKSSANTILKFLEEPPENVIAILLTNNTYNVIDTIVSRCQKLVLCNHEVNYSFSEEVEQLAEVIEKYKENALGHIENSWYTFDRETLTKKLLELENYYIARFHQIKESYKENDKKVLSSLSKKILIIDECLKKLRYNVNIKLLIDKFILSITEVI